MENGEHCTSTVYKSFLKHLKRSKLRHTAGTKKGKLADTWSWVCGRAKSSFYSRHELQETRQWVNSEK